jgi:hypothetical protein
MCAIERSLQWAPASLSLSKSARLALAKDQDPRPAIERPREQHTLILATGERRTHVPDQALVAHRHAFGVGFDLGEVRALAHPRHVDLLIEPRDVLGERALQETVILRDEGDLAAKTLSVPAGEGLAVDEEAREASRRAHSTGA